MEVMFRLFHIEKRKRKFMAKNRSIQKSRKTPSPPRRPLEEAEIERLNEQGIGSGSFLGRELLVAGALPGERVAFDIEHRGQRRIIGRLRRVLKPSGDRAPSPCPHAGRCQGCTLIGMDYSAQLRFKEEKVRQALGRYSSLSPAKIHPVRAAGQALEYRTNAKLAIGRDRGQIRIGLYRRGTHDVEDIGDCPLHHPLINRIVDVVREEIRQQGIYVYNPVTGTGLLRYLGIRVSPAFNKAMVTFVTAQRNYREVTHLAKWLQKKVPEVISVQQNVNASEGNVIFGRETIRILGAPDLIDSIGDIRLRISPTSFFQVNHEQASRIYDLARRWADLKNDETALDLYCGIGGIALHLAPAAGKVIGIEVVEEAVRNARENARMNNVGNCEFRAGDAADLVHDLALENPPVRVAVLNPPRSGCAPEVLKSLAGLSPRALIYVSCDPDTLARDLDLLSALGYQTREVQPVDMFPQTPHIESVARLVPAGKNPAK